MWLLHLLPTSFLLWVVNTVLYVGIATTIAGFFITFIPFVNRYRLPTQIIGVIILTAGVYFKGGYSVETEWRSRVAEVEKKVAVAEEKAKKASSKIQIKIVEKIKIVKQNVEKTKIIIQKEKAEINRECKLNDVAIDVYNQSVTNTAKEVTPNAK